MVGTGGFEPPTPRTPSVCATKLRHVPIVQGLIGSGMGKGPALALLLAGPALSLPSVLVLRSIMGAKKTVIFVSLVVVMATFTGMLFGWMTA